MPRTRHLSANTADAALSLSLAYQNTSLFRECGPHKPSSLIHQEPIMSQTRASIPYVTAFTPQENSNVSPNGSMSKLTILQPFGVNPDIFNFSGMSTFDTIFFFHKNKIFIQFVVVTFASPCYARDHFPPWKETNHKHKEKPGTEQLNNRKTICYVQ